MKILKFSAIWCPECLVMRPMWSEIEKEIPELEIECYDVDENLEAMERYIVTHIPTFIFLDKDGCEFLRLRGVQNKDELRDIIKKNYNK